MLLLLLLSSTVGVVGVVLVVPVLVVVECWTKVAGDQLRRDVTGLLPGSLYFFRVAGVNRMGQGPWSEMTDMVRTSRFKREKRAGLWTRKPGDFSLVLGCVSTCRDVHVSLESENGLHSRLDFQRSNTLL